MDLEDRLGSLEPGKDADVLVWGYGPGSLDRLGFTREALMELNPNLVLARETAYGPKGPWANRKGWEQLSQTCSGMVDLATLTGDIIVGLGHENAGVFSNDDSFA